MKYFKCDECGRLSSYEKPLVEGKAKCRRCHKGYLFSLSKSRDTERTLELTKSNAALFEENDQLRRELAERDGATAMLIMAAEAETAQALERVEELTSTGATYIIKSKVETARFEATVRGVLFADLVLEEIGRQRRVAELEGDHV